MMLWLHCFGLVVASSALFFSAATAEQTLKKDLFQELAFSGCYTHSRQQPIIEGRKRIDSRGLSRDTCLKECLERRYKLFGLKAGSECHCGNSLLHSVTVESARCGMPCPGDSSQQCGGANEMAVYKTNVVKFFDKPVTEVMATSFYGCYRDDKANSILKDAIEEKNLAMTHRMCTDICKRKDFKLLGLKSGNVCYCGSGLHEGATVEADKCTSPCMGDTQARCGGPRHTEVYQILKIGNFNLDVESLVQPPVRKSDEL